MRRDSDLLRRIILDVEAEPDDPVKRYHRAAIDDVFREHLRLLVDAGLLEKLGQKKDPIDVRLTPAGHDFANAIRDESIWRKTKGVVAETGGNATVEIMKRLAIGFLTKKIKDHTGVDV